MKFAHVDLYNINAHTKFGENPLMFTQVIIRKQKTDGRRMDGLMDGLTDDQRETIIPRHYCVAGYKKMPYLELWNFVPKLPVWQKRIIKGKQLKFLLKYFSDI